MDNNELKSCPFCGAETEVVKTIHAEEKVFPKVGARGCPVCRAGHSPTFWNTRACDRDKLSAVIQEISDYVFGNGLACMSGSKILESFVRHGLKVKCLEIGKTEIQSIKGDSDVLGN